jgi:hypothetical protein
MQGENRNRRLDVAEPNDVWRRCTALAAKMTHMATVYGFGGVWVLWR